jgi:serine/threonine protein kinase
MSASSVERSTFAPSPQLPRLGRYEALAKLATGGTGTVYLARTLDDGLERLYAIKVLHEHLAKRPAVVAMLHEEARITSQIQHINVVDTVEVGETVDGEHYLVMAYVEGVSLDDLLEHPTLDAIGRLRLGLPILLDAMFGLEAAHRATDTATGEPLGVVHRDVSPGNILVGMDGIARVADFGIASARMHGSSSDPDLLYGTPRYMAPEQTRGGVIDHRADVFALGTVLWEIITGEPLFDSRVSVEHILTQVVSATIPPPSDRNSRISAQLDAVCLRALQRDVSERYETVASFRAALVQATEADDLIATPDELMDELERLFGERIERRRALVRRVTGRKSGSRIRKATDTQTWLAPLRDPAAEAAASARSSLITTQIGLRPVKPAPTADAAIALEAFTTRDDEHEPSSEPTEVLTAYRVPRKHWRRWAVLAASVALIGVWRLVATDAPRPTSIAAPAAVVAPRVAAPTRTAASPPQLELASEPSESAAPQPVAKRPARVWKPLPVRPRSVVEPAQRPGATAPAEMIPLEPNPYLLQR